MTVISIEDWEKGFAAVITFTLDDEQEALIKSWQQSHPCRFRDPKTGERRGGTVGDLDTYTFVPTSIGIFASVKCGCGSSVDVTHHPL